MYIYYNYVFGTTVKSVAGGWTEHLTAHGVCCIAAAGGGQVWKGVVLIHASVSKCVRVCYQSCVKDAARDPSGWQEETTWNCGPNWDREESAAEEKHSCRLFLGCRWPLISSCLIFVARSAVLNKEIPLFGECFTRPKRKNLLIKYDVFTTWLTISDEVLDWELTANCYFCWSLFSAFEQTHCTRMWFYRSD